MKYTPQSIPEVLLLEPKVYGDERGYFTETFRQDLFEELLGFEINFIQDNESKSAKGVLRGLHYQLPPFSQAKLVRVVDGSILDVVVDIRKNSSNFGRHLSVIINASYLYLKDLPMVLLFLVKLQYVHIKSITITQLLMNKDSLLMILN